MQSPEEQQAAHAIQRAIAGPQAGIRLQITFLQAELDHTPAAAEQDLLRLHSALAAAHGALGEYPQALHHAIHELPLREHAQGSRHPDTLTTRASIADWTGESGDAAGALRLYQELLPDLETVQGPRHPDTLTARGNIARWTGMCRDSRPVTDADGLLSRAERSRLWADLADAEDDPDLPDRLIRMMEAFDLAYRVGNDADSEDVALIVDRLPDAAPPDVDGLWGQERAGPGMREIAIIYKLASRQAGIPTWFIAREHRYTTHRHWRYGALLHDRDPRTPAWALLTDDGREQPTITLQVAGAYPVRFLSVLTEAFDNIIEARYPGLVEARLVPCACQSEVGGTCTHAFDLEDLVAEATADEPDADHKVRCPKSRRKIEAALMLDGPGYPVLRDIRELHMVTWLTQNANTNQEVAVEAEKRIDALRTGASRRDWKPY